MTRRSTRPRAYAPDPAAPGRGCEMPGCPHAGEYRAPKSRASLREYWWFCLDHVRAYNSAWDYYRGMSPAEIEAQTRSDTGWQRPTWPLGRVGAAVDDTALRDELAAMGARFGLHRAAGHPAPDQPPAELREPLATLGLAWPVSMADLKHRYKTLAKQHHPDANGGDPAAEERLKTINLAYAAVRGRVLPAASAAG